MLFRSKRSLMEGEEEEEEGEEEEEEEERSGRASCRERVSSPV